MTGTKLRKDVREVYFVQGFELKLIKIGVSNDTRRRMVSMQTFSPDRLLVLGVQLCLQRGALEEKLHRRFQEHRQHGEWFSPAPEIFRYIEDHTVALDDVPAARAELVAADGVRERILAKHGKRQEAWLRANGFAHLIGY